MKQAMVTMARAFRFRNRKREEGFTLVEMVVALFVVSVVMAITLPNLQVAGVNAAKTGCEGNQRMIRAALTEYYLNEHQFPAETTVQGDLQDLVTAGYLDSIPACPSGGSYIITISADGTAATVSCTVHGSLGGD